ncbi:hypothetical protein V6N13_002551 [Hibiscus sabdariffa]|uniref:Uncharacterized protein n=2 Tax=Hibiscus sabdariffa TaxID=183260 RepID=A0ABR2C4Q2_9ROSI
MGFRSVFFRPRWRSTFLTEHLVTSPLISVARARSRSRLATYSKIENGKIAELDGVRVRALFKWWSITGIRLRTFMKALSVKAVIRLLKS